MVNNKLKACALFAGIVFVLYGGQLTNISRNPMARSSQRWPQDRPPQNPYGSSYDNPVTIGGTTRPGFESAIHGGYSKLGTSSHAPMSAGWGS